MRVRVGSIALTVAMLGGASVLAPPPASACIGGMPFRHAIAETRGGILEGRITHAIDTMGRGMEVELADVRRVAGRPDLVTEAVLMAGVVCEQSIDVGETVWLLYDVGDLEILPTLTIAYVVVGPDAVSDEDRLWAIGALPDTSTEPSSPSRGAGWAPILMVALWVLTFVTGMRRWQWPPRMAHDGQTTVHQRIASRPPS